MNLAEVEMDWLSRHLVHDICVHRQHESIVELAKISKILFASENGMIHKYKEQTLEDIPAENLLSEGDNSDFEPEEDGDGNEDDEDEDDKNYEEKPRISKRKVNQSLETNNKPKKEKNSLDHKQRTKLFDFFKDHIQKYKVPRKQECESFLKLNRIESNWLLVKDIVNARVQKEKKKRPA